jgi:hypothetical protein
VRRFSFFLGPIEGLWWQKAAISKQSAVAFLKNFSHGMLWKQLEEMIMNMAFL